MRCKKIIDYLKEPLDREASIMANFLMVALVVFIGLIIWIY